MSTLFKHYLNTSQQPIQVRHRMSSRDNHAAVEILQRAVRAHALRVVAARIGELGLTTAHLAANVSFEDANGLIKSEDAIQTLRAFITGVANMAKTLGLATVPAGFRNKMGALVSAYQHVVFTENMFKTFDAVDQELVRISVVMLDSLEAVRASILTRPAPRPTLVKAFAEAVVAYLPFFHEWRVREQKRLIQDVKNCLLAVAVENMLRPDPVRADQLDRLSATLLRQEGQEAVDAVMEAARTTAVAHMKAELLAAALENLVEPNPARAEQVERLSARLARHEVNIVLRAARAAAIAQLKGDLRAAAAENLVEPDPARAERVDKLSTALARHVRRREVRSVLQEARIDALRTVGVRLGIALRELWIPAPFPFMERHARWSDAMERYNHWSAAMVRIGGQSRFDAVMGVLVHPGARATNAA